ncbi:hypothetical protein [Streptomyces sp. NBC_00258]|uniref:hypothetical protein n=1 Tax=Streptomyces sp. NBC_00258 TaxID=2903642 RepID=UPI002E2D19AD|nr:hypothetical protein [Streptomyces sp. NBC_00258]
MAATSRDPHNNRELAAVVLLGARIARLERLGKPTKRLENRVDRIREQAQKREDAKRRK